MVKKAKQQTAYVAGGMTAIPGHNFAAFDAATFWLRGKGWRVISPAEEDRKLGFDGSATDIPFEFTSEGAMKRDLHWITHPDTDALVLLPDWIQSPGARKEAQTAVYSLLDIYLYQPDGVFEDPEKRLVEISHSVIDFMLNRKIENDAETEDGERRIVNAATGGAKGQKLARFDLVPSDSEWALAEHFGRGAQKYADRNWELGTDWSLNYAAARRHLGQWWGGEDHDKDGNSHLIAVAWHMFVLYHFGSTHPELDDRP